MKRNPTLGLAAALLVLAVAAPAAAHDSGDKEQKQKIIILTERHEVEVKDKDGAHADAHGEAMRHGSRMLIADCGGDKQEFSGENEAKGEKAKIVLCTRGNVSAADRAGRLEHVLARINSNDELSAETKARIVTALRDAIARLNASH